MKKVEQWLKCGNYTHRSYSILFGPQALHKFKKESARDKRETKLLARLKAKEEQFVEKIDFIKANLDQYTQPEEKIQQIEGELIDIRAKISKVILSS